MLDRERVIGKIALLDDYLRELDEIAPVSFGAYEANLEKKRACERLLQITIEAAIDVCRLMVKGMRLGLPADEDDIFSRLEKAEIISQSLVLLLRKMKGARNILVHEYGKIDDAVVFDIVRESKIDFTRFRREIITFLNKYQSS